MHATQLGSREAAQTLQRLEPLVRMPCDSFDGPRSHRRVGRTGQLQQRSRLARPKKSTSGRARRSEHPTHPAVGRCRKVLPLPQPTTAALATWRPLRARRSALAGERLGQRLQLSSHLEHLAEHIHLVGRHLLRRRGRLRRLLVVDRLWEAAPSALRGQQAAAPSGWRRRLRALGGSGDEH